MHLELSALSVRYPGAPRPSVDQVSFGLGRGDIGVLIGPSGCGKTTLLRAIAGLERASAGEIRISGHVVGSERLHVARCARRVGASVRPSPGRPLAVARQRIPKPSARSASPSRSRPDRLSGPATRWLDCFDQATSGIDWLRWKACIVAS